MKVFFVALLCLGSFVGGYAVCSTGYRVVTSDGSSVVKSNAAQVVKDENARMGREVLNKTVEEAEALLKKGQRTLFVGVSDGKTNEYKGQKTFTNLTVEVKDGKVVKVLGWY